MFLGLRYGLRVLKNHKFKTILALALLYGGYKTYGLYKFLKMSFQGITDPHGATLPENEENSSDIANNSQTSESEREFFRYIKEDPLNLLEIKIF